MRRTLYGWGRWDRNVPKAVRQFEIAKEQDRVAERNERLRERGLIPLAGVNAKGKGKPAKVRRAINRAAKRDALLPDPRICGVCNNPKPKSRQWVVVTINGEQKAMCKSCYIKVMK